MPTGVRPSPGPLSREIARIVREHMSRDGMPLKELAEAAGMSTSQLSRVLNVLKVFTLEQLDAVCYALGTAIVAVLAEADAASHDRFIGDRPASRVTTDLEAHKARRARIPPSRDDLGAVARTADKDTTPE